MNTPQVDVVATGITRDYDAQYKIKVLKANVSFSDQTTESNTKYVIRWDFDLKGEEVAIPENCILKFDGGSLSNGFIIGNNTVIERPENYGCLSSILIGGTYSNMSVDTSIYTDDIVYIDNLINLVGDGGTINLYKDVYTSPNTDRQISKSITISGYGNTVYVSHDGKLSDGFLDIEDCEKLVLKNINFNGQVEPWDGEWRANYKSFLVADNVDNVTIENCVFENFYYHNNVDSPFYPFVDEDNYPIASNYIHWAFIGVNNYLQMNIKGCTFKNITADEGINVFPKDWKSFDSDSTIHISDNIFIGEIAIENDNYICVNSCVSSWVNVNYGKGIICNNEFGGCSGSHINAFMYDSIIELNEFNDGIRSCAIDLDEGQDLDFMPRNVLVRNNYAERIVGGFIMMGAVDNVVVENNVLDNTDNIKTTKFAALNRGNAKTAFDSKTLTFRNNISLGNVRFILQEYNTDFGNLYIEKNIVSYAKGDTFYENLITICSSGNLFVKDNYMYSNCKCTMNPSGTVGIDSASFIGVFCRYDFDTEKPVNAYIENNVFKCPDKCVVFRTYYANGTYNQLYLKNIGFISVQNNKVEYEENIADNGVGIFVLSKDWSHYNSGDDKLIIKNNSFPKTVIISNVKYSSDIFGYDAYFAPSSYYGNNFSYRSELGLHIYDLSNNINIPKVEYEVRTPEYLAAAQRRNDTSYPSGYMFSSDGYNCIVISGGISSSDGSSTLIEDDFYRDGSLVYKRLCPSVELKDSANAIPIRIVPSMILSSENLDEINIGSSDKFLGLNVFAKDLGKQVYWNGSVWVDALGNNLDEQG